MDTRPRRSTLRWASEYVVTAERGGNGFLVMATIGLIVAFCLPWWSLWMSGYGGLGRPSTLVATGFSGWGWCGGSSATFMAYTSPQAVLRRCQSTATWSWTTEASCW